MEEDLLADNATNADPYDQKVTLLVTERLEPFHLFWQSPVISTGRISKEMIAQEDTSRIFIEGEHANVPVRVELNVDRLLSYSLFPGQVCAIKGTNPTSKLFRLNGIRAPSELPAFPCTGPPPGTSFSLVCASGPFAFHRVSASLQPLNLLLDQVRHKKPDILLLQGPFVDQKQTDKDAGMIQYHGTDYSAEQWFRLQIDMIMQAVQDIPTKVLILPSLRDVHHPVCVYPQPRYSSSHPDLGTVRSLPSYSLLSLITSLPSETVLLERSGHLCAELGPSHFRMHFCGCSFAPGWRSPL